MPADSSIADLIVCRQRTRVDELLRERSASRKSRKYDDGLRGDARNSFLACERGYSRFDVKKKKKITAIKGTTRGGIRISRGKAERGERATK